MNSASAKIRTIFSTPGWARFINAIREYRDGGRPLPSNVTIAAPTHEERRRHAALLRMSTPSRAMRLRYDLDALSQSLLASGLPGDWETILEIVCGRIPNAVLAERAARMNWQDFWPTIAETIGRDSFAQYHEWLDALRHDGVLKRLTAGDVAVATTLVEMSARLLRALPLKEGQPLTQVAAQFCGDSHALDPTRPVSSLVLRALALRSSKPLPSRASDRRQLWADFGVLCDTLSAPVLTFNLGIGGNAPLAALIQLATSIGQPIHLSTCLLWTSPWDSLAFPTRVFICENPTIVALAASRLGARCPPLVCVDGEVKSAGRLLLRALKHAGAKLHYHGDFDWPGLAIADRVFREFGAEPWSFDAETYVAACRRPGRPLDGLPVLSPWSPQLAEVMERTGKAFDEELLANDLLAVLEEASGGVVPESTHM